MQKKALEIDLYVVGAGAFAVFLRWMEDQLAFNELGLADPSVFHYLLLAFLLAAALVFRHFLNRLQKARMELSEDFSEALRNEGKLYRILRWAAGGVMCLGAVALFAVSETDKYVGMVRVLAVLGFLSGLAFPLLLAEANKEQRSYWKICILATLPVLTFGAWLVTSYRENSINSVAWAYAVDVFVPIAAMNAYFRMAGFAFNAAKPRRAMFAVMFGAVLCMMALADEKYLGLHLMNLGAAAQMALYTWIMVSNMQKGAERKKIERDDGFEHL